MTSGPKIVLMLAPAIALIGVLFGGGLLLGFLQSLQAMPGEVGPTLHAYRTVLGARTFLASLGFSLYIALTATILSALIAVAAAMLLRQTFFGRGLIGFLFQINLTIPHVVGAIGILYLFSQSGSFARLAAATAFIDDRNAIGIILHYVWKEVPFIGLILLSQMQSIGHEYEAASRSLGATRWQAFRHVTLPLVAPGLIAASVIVFAFSFGAYEVPLILGPNAPAALPVLAYRAYVDVDLAARPQAMAMAMVIALISAALILIALRAARQALRR
jgi:putative spermidine/putrescine transport system permease protein